MSSIEHWCGFRGFDFSVLRTWLLLMRSLFRASRVITWDRKRPREKGECYRRSGHVSSVYLRFSCCSGRIIGWGCASDRQCYWTLLLLIKLSIMFVVFPDREWWANGDTLLYSWMKRALSNVYHSSCETCSCKLMDDRLTAFFTARLYCKARYMPRRCVRPSITLAY